MTGTALPINHLFVSTKLDDPASSITGKVKPSDWNAGLVVTGTDGSIPYVEGNRLRQDNPNFTYTLTGLGIMLMAAPIVQGTIATSTGTLGVSGAFFADTSVLETNKTGFYSSVGFAPVCSYDGVTGYRSLANNVIATPTELSFFGGTPQPQITTSTVTTTFTAGGGTALDEKGTHDGGVGGTGYTFGDIVYAMKYYKLLG